MQRLFFALWPDNRVRARLAASATQPALKRRPVATHNYHLTLHFVGAADAALRRCLIDAAGGVVAPPFALQLGEWGYWQRPSVAWLAPVESPPALLRLVTALRAAAVACGLPAEARAYLPHVTLARRVLRRPAWPDSPVIHWPVSDFVLCQSVSEVGGVRYEVLQRWPLSS